MNAGVHVCGGNRLAIPGTLLNNSSDFSIGKVFCLQADHACSDGLYIPYLVVCCQQSLQEAASVDNPSVFALQLTHHGTVVTRNFTRISRFHFSPTTSEH
jgi:hypothetical protein